MVAGKREQSQHGRAQRFGIANGHDFSAAVDDLGRVACVSGYAQYFAGEPFGQYVRERFAAGG